MSQSNLDLDLILNNLYVAKTAYYENQNRKNSIQYRKLLLDFKNSMIDEITHERNYVLEEMKRKKLTTTETKEETTETKVEVVEPVKVETAPVQPLEIKEIKEEVTPVSPPIVVVDTEKKLRKERVKKVKTNETKAVTA